MADTPPFTTLARAKVNLTLRVHGRRADGFHELDSVVAFADIGDAVTLVAGAPIGVAMRGPFASAIGGENLAQRALSLAAAAAPELQLGHVTIDKQIPVAAGLGGGSADAAAVLRLIQRANPAHAARHDWLALAAGLGSDVPVCFADRACRMSGRGEIVEPIGVLPPLPAVLINPQVPVPPNKTRAVFTQLAAPPLGDSHLLCSVTGSQSAGTAIGGSPHFRSEPLPQTTLE